MRTKGRTVRDEADARACLEAARASGLPLRDWAHANAVDGRSLNNWKTKLGTRPASRALAAQPANAPPLRVVELVPHERPAARYVVRLGDVAVEVDDAFDDGTLRRLLAVVASC